MPREKEALLQELIERYSKMHMKQAYNNGVPYDDVEDIVLGAYWSFYQSRYFGNLSEEETKVMMAHIVRNKCRDYYRKNCHIETVGIDECRDELELVSHASVQDPLNKMIQNEEYCYICQCIEEMKEIWREPALLYFIEGYTPREIHKILGISETVCRSRLSRARKYLREKLADMRT
ncbi:MAG: sigma-70 family RNA polymerase sigma factor [Lachnospiraceae bacterium]|nr:sigma-70 family RNA polymerase sigma factor [Lachnospiraceae bacterium]